MGFLSLTSVILNQLVFLKLILHIFNFEDCFFLCRLRATSASWTHTAFRSWLFFTIATIRTSLTYVTLAWRRFAIELLSLFFLWTQIQFTPPARHLVITIWMIIRIESLTRLRIVIIESRLLKSRGIVPADVRNVRSIWGWRNIFLTSLSSVEVLVRWLEPNRFLGFALDQRFLVISRFGVGLGIAID